MSARRIAPGYFACGNMPMDGPYMASTRQTSKMVRPPWREAAGRRIAFRRAPRRSSTRRTSASRFCSAASRRGRVVSVQAILGAFASRSLRRCATWARPWMCCGPGYRAGTITNRSTPDSAPHASPARPSICRTVACSRFDGKLSNFCVTGSNLTMAFALHSVNHTLSWSLTHTAYACGLPPGSFHSRHHASPGRTCRLGRCSSNSPRCGRANRTKRAAHPASASAVR